MSDVPTPGRRFSVKGKKFVLLRAITPHLFLVTYPLPASDEVLLRDVLVLAVPEGVEVEIDE